METPIGFLSTSVYYSETTDLIDRHKYIKEYDGQPYSILTWVNKGKTQDSGLEFMFMTKPLPFWRFMISGNFWYNNTIEAQDEDMKGIESGFIKEEDFTFNTATKYSKIVLGLDEVTDIISVSAVGLNRIGRTRKRYEKQ